VVVAKASSAFNHFPFPKIWIRVLRKFAIFPVEKQSVFSFFFQNSGSIAKKLTFFPFKSLQTFSFFQKNGSWHKWQQFFPFKSMTYRYRLKVTVA